MLEHLWNGWRAQYVQRDSKVQSTDGSIFTQILRSGLPDEETYIVHRGVECFVILNAFPYSPGHLLVLPYREVGEIELLNASAGLEFRGGFDVQAYVQNALNSRYVIATGGFRNGTSGVTRAPGITYGLTARYRF